MAFSEVVILGSDCFYQHLNEDGTPHVFTEGVDVMMVCSILKFWFFWFILFSFRVAAAVTTLCRVAHWMLIPFKLLWMLWKVLSVHSCRMALR